MPIRGPVRVATSWQSAQKVGAPDFEPGTFRAKSVWGYMLEPDESFLWCIIIATAAPGPYAFTRAGIPSGVTVDLLDAFTGLAGVTPPAGYDFLFKEIWIGFDQPVRFQMIQDAIGDVSCENYIPAFSSGYISGFHIGWSRAQCEPIAVSTRTRLQITNLGTSLAYGKSWVVGFMRPREYTWY